MDDFMIYALLAGTGVVLMTTPLGVFVSWRRMAYFGDTLAHSGLLGIAFGLMLDINLNLAIIMVSVSVALLLIVLQNNRQIATDTLLGILAHSNLAFGMLIMSLQDNTRIDLMAYLFGDILAVNTADLLLIWIAGLLLFLIMLKLWQPLLAITVHEELAQVEGVPTKQVKLVFMLAIAVVIAISMKIVGVLLVTALMIIPAATARKFSRSPEQMLLFACLSGLLSVIGGISLSWFADTLAGPSIVATAAVLFFLSQLTHVITKD